MKITGSIAEIRTIVQNARKEGKRIGFVPTMGYLHKGHLSLVEISKQHADFQVMSIFVNRIQFNDKKDFEDYPRDFERDFALAQSAGVHLMFTPDERDMYQNHLTYVEVESLSKYLCGATRPGHFRGVCTVVSKLFNIVLPDVSVFGRKDIQQALIIEKMVHDLNFPIQIITAPTIREEGGLAMSSRNKHLSHDERTRALSIHRGLLKAKSLIESGNRNTTEIKAVIQKEIEAAHPQKIDYIELVSYNSLHPIEKLDEKAILAVAAFFGNTRLIDNMLIHPCEGGFTCEL
ncbi:MAG: pantoate--beta-alanine ligase [Spirochaetes bacterium]|nr:pantoate--beta-alanine ligase [Spirochaetota bacterium]